MYNNDRQMHDVDLDCAKCNTKITQLPFQPSGDRPVYCQECNRAYRESRQNNDRGPRQMFDVDVDCAQCNTKITQLPFQPTAGKPIYCRECLQSRRDS